MARGAATKLQDDDRRPALVDAAYDGFKQAILDSTFPPGFQVSAQELALRLGMSRTPIHEAALKLQQEGLVRIVPKRGIVICALAPDDIREIYDVIIAIEASAAAGCAATPEMERRAIADILDAQTSRMASAVASGDLAVWGQADAEFHRLLIEKCGNQRFARIMHTVNDQSHRARMLTLRLRPRLPASTEEHRSIAAAIRGGDPEAARLAAHRHRTRARDELLPLIESIGLRHL